LRAGIHSSSASNLHSAIADNPGMSLPRAIVPGRRYMITRRCSERRFFMRPDRETNNAFSYCLAIAARKASISIVCVGTLSNHYRVGVVDNHGRLPPLQCRAGLRELGRRFGTEVERVLEDPPESVRERLCPKAETAPECRLP
jgi:hypothetical protein